MRSAGVAGVLAAVMVLGACSGGSVKPTTRSTTSPQSVSPTPNPTRHHHRNPMRTPNAYRGDNFVDGVEAARRHPLATINCANHDLGRVKPGGRIDVSIRDGAQRVRLTGTALGRWYSRGHVMMRGGHVTLMSGGRVSLRYRLPHWTRSEPRVAMTIGSRSVHGYLCLVKFQPGQPASAVVGVSPIFMGAAPELVILTPGASKPQFVHSGFHPWAIKLTTASPIIRTTDSRFFGVGSFDADSGAPLNFYTVEGTNLLDVSASYPAAIGADAAMWWKQFQHPHHGPYLGAIASWVADECELGRQSYALGVLDRLQRTGTFRGYIALRHHHFRHVSYATHVKRVLRGLGYLRG